MDAMMTRLLTAALSDADDDSLAALGRELGRRGYVPSVECHDGRVVVLPEVGENDTVLFRVLGTHTAGQMSGITAALEARLGRRCLVCFGDIRLDGVIRGPVVDAVAADG